LPFTLPQAGKCEDSLTVLAGGHFFRVSRFVLKPGAAWRDGCEEQFGPKSTAGKIRGDRFLRFVRRGSRIKENNDRRSRAAEGRPQDAWLPSQFLQTGEQRAERRAVGLVDAVFERS